jgi:hypothetical protein
MTNITSAAKEQFAQAASSFGSCYVWKAAHFQQRQKNANWMMLSMSTPSSPSCKRTVGSGITHAFIALF